MPMFPEDRQITAKTNALWLVLYTRIIHKYILIFHPSAGPDSK
jgi:hypothetical protein